MSFKSSFTVSAVTAIGFCLIGPTVPAAADILHVPGDFPTIQAAIDAAMDGDEVEVHPGNYNETINLLGKAITVRSSDGADVTTINGTGLGDSVVKCLSGEGPDTILDGFTIIGGNADAGGGMRNDSSSPTITNCTFSGNSAQGGGGMYNRSGSSPTLTNCTFSGNAASGKGGGMYNLASDPVLINCTFSGNSASNNGGGMCNTVQSSPTLTNCMFTDNMTFIDGGGMSNDASSPIVTDCTFNGNSAGRGGGMANSDSSPTMNNSVFTQNVAHVKGGGMYNSYSSPTLTNCEFVNNYTCDGDGGGMFNRSNSKPTLTNCILWDNIPDGIQDNAGSETAVRYSDVQQGWPGEGNIDALPLFVDPYNGDYHLSAGSPCIDAADNTAVPKGLDTDLDGNPRFVDDPCTDDTGNEKPPLVDMGAYEFQVTCPWDLDCTGSVGAVDLLSLLVSWGPCNGCHADFDGDGSVGASDLLALLANWGPCP